MKTAITILTIYITSWLFSWGALMADTQRIGDKEFANKYYRKHLAATCLFAAAPILNLTLAIFATGFMEHGWRLSRREQ